MPNSLEDFKPESRFLGLFISRSGDGKSTAGASFPEPYHELDPDLRFGGIAGSSKQGILKNKKITYDQFSPLGGWDPVNKVLEQLNIYRMGAAQNRITFPYKTIGLGSLGSLERIVLNFAKEHIESRVKVGGILKLGAPGDQKAANSGVHQVIDYLQAMPCNIICTAHLIEKWGKPKLSTNASKQETDAATYRPNEIIGEKLNLNDNLAESVTSRFDNVFRFSRETQIDGGEAKIHFYVEFAGDLAKNSYGLPPGYFDWTGKDFFTYFMQLVDKVNTGVTKFGGLSKI